MLVLNVKSEQQIKGCHIFLFSYSNVFEPCKILFIKKRPNLSHVTIRFHHSFFIQYLKTNIYTNHYYKSWEFSIFLNSNHNRHSNRFNYGLSNLRVILCTPTLIIYNILLIKMCAHLFCVFVLLLLPTKISQLHITHSVQIISSCPFNFCMLRA